MPNILAHAYITDQVFPNTPTDLLIGSTLPDFLGMHRDYQKEIVNRRNLVVSGVMMAGIDFHYRTDSAFDSLSIRRSLLGMAREDLLTTIPHLGRGATRACADIGTDILLDGVMLEEGDFVEVYDRLKCAVLHDEHSLSAAGSISLAESVTKYFASSVSNNYCDPGIVAKILQDRFERRRGTWIEFSKSDVPYVTDVFDRQRARIRLVAHQLLGLTVTKLQGGPDVLANGNILSSE